MMPEWQRRVDQLSSEIGDLRRSIRDIKIGLFLTAVTAILCAVAIIIGE